MFVKQVRSVEFSKAHEVSSDSVLLWFSVCIFLYFGKGGQELLHGSREINRFWSAVEEEVVPDGVPL